MSMTIQQRDRLTILRAHLHEVRALYAEAQAEGQWERADFLGNAIDDTRDEIKAIEQAAADVMKAGPARDAQNARMFGSPALLEARARFSANANGGRGPGLEPAGCAPSAGPLVGRTGNSYF